MALWLILPEAGSGKTLFEKNKFETDHQIETRRKADGTARKHQNAQHIEGSINSVTWLEFMITFV